MSSLIFGISMIVCAIAIFLVVYRATRSATPVGLFSDSWVANIHAPLMIGLFTFGSGYLIKFALVAIP